MLLLYSILLQFIPSLSVSDVVLSLLVLCYLCRCWNWSRYSPQSKWCKGPEGNVKKTKWLISKHKKLFKRVVRKWEFRWPWISCTLSNTLFQELKLSKILTGGLMFTNINFQPDRKTLKFFRFLWRYGSFTVFAL